MKIFKILSRFFVGLSLVMMTTLTFAKALPEPVDDYVNDFSNVIDEYDTEEIRTKLHELEIQTGIEMVVVTIDSIKPYQSAQADIGSPLVKFARNLFNQWGVGQMPDNDGVMLLMVIEDKKVRIQMGSGYNHRYDSAMKKIIDEQLIPEFRAGNFSLGAASGVQDIIDTVTTSPDVIWGMNWLELILVVVSICFLITGIGLMAKGDMKAGWIMLFAALGMLFTAFLSNQMRDNDEDNYSGGFGGGFSDDDGASGSWGDD